MEKIKQIMTFQFELTLWWVLLPISITAIIWGYVVLNRWLFIRKIRRSLKEYPVIDFTESELLEFKNNFEELNQRLRYSKNHVLIDLFRRHVDKILNSMDWYYTRVFGVDGRGSYNSCAKLFREFLHNIGYGKYGSDKILRINPRSLSDILYHLYMKPLEVHRGKLQFGPYIQRLIDDMDARSEAGNATADFMRNCLESLVALKEVHSMLLFVSDPTREINVSRLSAAFVKMTVNVQGRTYNEFQEIVTLMNSIEIGSIFTNKEEKRCLVVAVDGIKNKLECCEQDSHNELKNKMIVLDL